MGEEETQLPHAVLHHHWLYRLVPTQTWCWMTPPMGWIALQLALLDATHCLLLSLGSMTWARTFTNTHSLTLTLHTHSHYSSTSLLLSH